MLPYTNLDAKEGVLMKCCQASKGLARPMQTLSSMITYLVADTQRHRRNNAPADQRAFTFPYATSCAGSPALVRCSTIDAADQQIL